MRTPLALVALLLALAPLGAVAAPISGTVFDQSRRPITGATVRVGDADGRTLVETTTDAQGRYSIDLPPTAVAIVFAGIGYRTIVVVGSRLANDVTPLVITLVPQLQLISSHRGTYFPSPCSAYHPNQLYDQYVVAAGKCGVPTGFRL